MLEWLHRKEIDAARWDRCVAGAANSLIYATTAYLDHMCDGWAGIIYRDYKAVMPLPIRSRWGIRYVAMPPFVQQCGIFAAAPVQEPLLRESLKLAQRHLRFGDYHVNYAHAPLDLPARNNFVLSLQPDYAAIRQGFQRDPMKSPVRARQYSLEYGTGSDPGAVIGLYRALYAHRQRSIRTADYVRFERLCGQLQQKGQVVLREVRAEGQLLSACLCLKDHRRLYFLVAATPPEGRQQEANYYLIDRLIAEFAGTGLLLDFEGSDVPGIARFYRKFGATNQPYYFCHWNHLPWPLRMLKK